MKAYNDAIYLSEAERAVLSTWTLERGLRRLPTPEFCADEQHAEEQDAHRFALRRVIADSAPRSISERLDRILINLAIRSDEPGAKIAVTHDHLYLFYSTSVRQMIFFGQALAARGWIDRFDRVPEEIKMTVEGWTRLADLEREPGNPAQAFVAMSFRPELDPAWEEGLRPGIEDGGYSPLRVDKREHNDKICDVIVAEIRKSALLVADVTLQRQGVYFEAGLAMGLGMPVIWCCRKDDLENCHFDTRQYNHIEWASPQELRKKLTRRIEATIAR
ncbi:MAG TPA: hypothetical protein VFX92_00155 [Candidatus Krumholzibacteria bacterium]|nr:hypothetical protein [Candidatus Krumholzibacteria bacterium]